MATNLVIDDKLVAEAVTRGKHKTKREAVTAALQFYIRQKKRAGLDALIGKVEYYDDPLPKATRKRRPA